MSTKEIERSGWVAQLAIAYMVTMRDCDRLELLGLFYDIARQHGVADGIDKMNDGLRAANKVLKGLPGPMGELFRRQAD
jgi:hypothetical protein